MTWFILVLMVACRDQPQWGLECGQLRKEVAEYQKARDQGTAYSKAMKKPECFSDSEQLKITQDYFDETCIRVEVMLKSKDGHLSFIQFGQWELERLLAEEPSLNTPENIERFAAIQKKILERYPP